VAILTRFLSGRGRPGTTTLVLGAGLVVNVAANLVLVPQLGINGAALASSISYSVTAVLTLAVFLRVSGRGLRETLILRRSDVAAAASAGAALLRRMRRRPGAGAPAVPANAEAAMLIVAEHDPGVEE
jgi:O-antigen/teichoic acid export membrane protein